MKSNLFYSVRGKLILVPLGMSKQVGPQCIDIECFFLFFFFFFFKSHTPPSASIHQALVEHEKCCMHNNQLATKNNVELEETPIMCEMHLISLQWLSDHKKLWTSYHLAKHVILKVYKNSKWTFDQ